ncbi:MAG TPA: hypothetical protein VIP05_09845 [Burkholderiaceae bacterium]
MRFPVPTLLLACTMQTASAAPVALPADLFDFWLGDWQVTWKNANGTTGKARNHVARVLDGNVIEENFEEDAGDPAPLLRGRSLSVRDPAGQWHQAWADNQGGFFALTGSADGDRRLFSTALTTAGAAVTGKRMVFHHITADAFTWDWEGTTDGGKTWKLLWRLDYKR